MTTAHFTYLAEGHLWHASSLDWDGVDPQLFAEVLARFSLEQPTDEVQVWFGHLDGRKPDAVARRPLGTSPAPRNLTTAR